MKMAVFWVAALCGLVRVYQRFRGLSCLHHQGPMPSPHSSPHHTLCPPSTSNHPHSHPLFTRLPPSGPYKGQVLYPLPPPPRLHYLTSLPWSPHPLLLAPWPSPDTDLSHRFARALLYRTCPPLSLAISARGFTHRPDDGGSTDFWNVGKLIQVHTALQPRRHSHLPFSTWLSSLFYWLLCWLFKSVLTTSETI
jgi:hypothetical protein